MSSIPVLLADAVAAVINTAEAANELGSTDFTARRSYPDWDDDFKDIKSLSVDVVYVSSGGDLVELNSADTYKTEPAIDIAIRKRFDPGDRETTGRMKNTAVDPLVLLVEKIHELLAGDRMDSITLAAGVTANWQDATVRTYCDYKKLREGYFLGLVRVSFSVSKSV